MSDQRVALKSYLGQKQKFRATFKNLASKENSRKITQLVALLVDVYPIDNKTGKKIRIANQQQIVLSKNGSKRVAADHCWVDFRKAMTTANFYDGKKKVMQNVELLDGDEIEFFAVVDEYPILRDFSVKERNKIWDDARAKAQLVFEQWNKENQKKNKAYEKMIKKNETIYQKYQDKKIDYAKMRELQDKEKAKFNSIKLKKIDDVKKQQQRILEKAKQKQQNVELVDYELTKISDIKVVDINHKNDSARIKYDWDRIKAKDIKYTNFLIAHSLNY